MKKLKKYVPLSIKTKFCHQFFVLIEKIWLLIKKTINEHFKKPPKSYGRGKLLKKNRDDSYALC